VRRWVVITHGRKEDDNNDDDDNNVDDFDDDKIPLRLRRDESRRCDEEGGYDRQDIDDGSNAEMVVNFTIFPMIRRQLLQIGRENIFLGVRFIIL